MSNTMTIYCEDCKVKYWYGQTSSGGRTIYNPEKLFDFLQKHQEHTTQCLNTDMIMKN